MEIKYKYETYIDLYTGKEIKKVRNENILKISCKSDEYLKYVIVLTIIVLGNTTVFRHSYDVNLFAQFVLYCHNIYEGEIMDKLYRGIIDCLLGTAVVMVSILAVINRTLFLMRVFDVLGVILLINGFHEAYDYFFYNHKKVHLHNTLILIPLGIMLIFYPSLPVRFVTFIFALYLTLMGIVKFISYLNYRKDKVKRRIFVLIGAMILVVDGIFLIFRNYIHIDIVLVVIGIYGILLGLSYIGDGIYTVIPEKKKDSIKRKIRIPLPMILSAFIPNSMRQMINNKLEVNSNRNIDVLKGEIDMEVFVHVSPLGFGKMGHCDLYFEGEVLSYGNYDYSSVRFFESIGDGVLFSVKDKMKYIRFCIKEDKKTIFGYGLKLTEKQKNEVRQKIKSLKRNAIRWYPVSYSQPGYKEDYASRLYAETKAEFYKFKSGKFKTYFVLGTNCVLLADQIIGSAGTDIIDLNGIIAPGTYQDYLEKELQRMNGFVVNKTIYHEI